ncbi:hypothetical protein [Candidatus Protochlamydia naegleriophila]|nr:hypothetical protein [Candidatus Protochlamydia naegleriophila]
MENFTFVITSSTEREKLAYEIYYKDELIAEITQETEHPLLEIYPLKENKWWAIPLEDFQQALSYAKNHLISP